MMRIPHSTMINIRSSRTDFRRLPHAVTSSITADRVTVGRPSARRHFPAHSHSAARPLRRDAQGSGAA